MDTHNFNTKETTDTLTTALSIAHGDPNFMQSLARGLEILQSFTPRRQRLSVSQLSQKTRISRAAVRRCLYTLSALGFVHSIDGRNYELLPRVLTLGHAYLMSTPLAKAAQNTLDHLCQTLNECCSVAILESGDALYIARASTGLSMNIDLGRGCRLPAYCCALGKILLCGLTKEALDAYLARTVFIPHTQYTITNADQLRATLEEIRRQGYVINDQQVGIGLRSVAVPMYSYSGRVVAAMSVEVHASQVTVNALKERILPALQHAAADLALIL